MTFLFPNDYLIDEIDVIEFFDDDVLDFDGVNNSYVMDLTGSCREFLEMVEYLLVLVGEFIIDILGVGLLDISLIVDVVEFNRLVLLLFILLVLYD